jgi:hypothetical protein
MELRPADLGLQRNLALIHQRAQHYLATNHAGGMHRSRARFAQNIAGAGGAPGRGSTTAGKQKPLGPLGRLWARMAGMDAETAKAALAGSNQMTNGFVGGFVGGSLGFIMPGFMITLVNASGAGDPPAALGLLFMTMGLAFSSIGVFIPGNLLKRWHQTAITPGEIEGLLADTDVSDTLERSYLMLLREALNQSNLSPEAENDLRAAIRSLGQTIDRIPPLSAGIRVDADELRSEARVAEAEARAESDPVIAASKARRAEALERSARAAEQSALLLRRSAALRDELAAQTEALRLGLAAFYSGAGDITDLSHLSESVRSVAAEASSVADARAELESATLPTPTGLRAGVADGTAAAQPQRVGGGLT